MNITEHADAILDAACAAPLSRHGWTNAERQAILAACQALHDEGARAGIEAAAKVCEQQRTDFLDPAYATGQPMSSMMERFACAEVLSAIRAIDIAKLGED